MPSKKINQHWVYKHDKGTEQYLPLLTNFFCLSPETRARDPNRSACLSRQPFFTNGPCEMPKISAECWQRLKKQEVVEDGRCQLLSSLMYEVHTQSLRLVLSWRARTSSSIWIFDFISFSQAISCCGSLLLLLLFPSLLGYSNFTATEWWTYAAKRQKSPKRYSLREAQVDNGSIRSAANNQSLACTREYSDCTGCRVWTVPHGARCAAVWFSNGGTLPQNSGLCAAMLQQRSDSAPECLCWTFLN